MLEDGAVGRQRTTEVMSPQCVRAIGGWLPPDMLLAPDVARVCSGIESRWSTPAIYLERFEPAQAFLVDRAALDRRLLEAAKVAGARVAHGHRVREVLSASKHITLLGTHEGGLWSVDARFVVDATGRASCVARQLGVARHHLIRQVASVGHARTARTPDRGNWFQVERSRVGWWTAAPTTASGWELVFYRSALAPKPPPQALARLFRSTHLARHAGEYEAGPRCAGLDAGFSALERVQGHRWVAIGDAAVAFDPVSSQGLWHAIGSARAAAGAVDIYLEKDDVRGLTEYEFRSFATLQHHAGQLRRHYEEKMP